MRKDTPFAWMKQCHLAFNMLKDKLCEAPILHYPDSSKTYTLFTDASKHGWAGVLTQEFETKLTTFGAFGIHARNKSLIHLQTSE